MAARQGDEESPLVSSVKCSESPDSHAAVTDRLRGRGEHTPPRSVPAHGLGTVRTDLSP